MSEKKKSDVHDAAVRLGSKGGKVGGPARARSLSSDEKSKIASKAAKARWAKAKAEKRAPSQKQKPKPTKTPKKESK